MTDKEVQYGSHGHAGKCLRCGGYVKEDHSINSCSIDDATVTAVSSYISSAKALAGKRVRNRETMRQARNGQIGQREIDESAERMIGALHAQTTTGVEFKLVTASGKVPLTNKVAGWELVDPGVPSQSSGWIDIYGNNFTMPPLPQGLNYSVPCAAIKLLLGLGKLNTKHLRFNWIHIYEEACAGVTEGGKRSSVLRQWHGEGKTFTYAAHSCRHCEVRVPMLLCDRSSG